jgi:hypothetical protein
MKKWSAWRKYFPAFTRQRYRTVTVISGPPSLLRHASTTSMPLREIRGETPNTNKGTDTKAKPAGCAWDMASTTIAVATLSVVGCLKNSKYFYRGVG